MLIIGAAAIGIEFGYVLSTLGTHVTIVEMVDQILPVEDTEVAQALEKIFIKRGVVIKTGVTITDLKKSSSGVSATSFSL